MKELRNEKRNNLQKYFSILSYCKTFMESFVEKRGNYINLKDEKKKKVVTKKL